MAMIDDFSSGTAQNFLTGGDGVKSYSWNLLNSAYASAIDSNSTNADKLTISLNTADSYIIDAAFAAPFVYQNAVGDFDIDIFISTLPTAWNQGIGLIARDPSASAGEDSVYVGATHNGGGVDIFSAKCANDVRSYYEDSNVTHPYLRISRVGNVFTLYSKENIGDSWTERQAFTRNDFAATVQIGIFAFEDDESGTFTTTVDYFEGTLNLSSPSASPSPSSSPSASVSNSPSASVSGSPSASPSASESNSPSSSPSPSSSVSASPSASVSGSPSSSPSASPSASASASPSSSVSASPSMSLEGDDITIELYAEGTAVASAGASVLDNISIASSATAMSGANTAVINTVALIAQGYAVGISPQAFIEIMANGTCGMDNSADVTATIQITSEAAAISSRVAQSSIDLPIKITVEGNATSGISGTGDINIPFAIDAEGTATTGLLTSSDDFIFSVEGSGTGACNSISDVLNVITLLSSATAISGHAAEAIGNMEIVAEGNALFGSTASLSSYIYSITSEGTVAVAKEAGEFACFVLNTLNNALTKYDNFDFTSLGNVGNACYGTRSDGIYRLDGDTDNGDPIEAYIVSPTVDCDIGNRRALIDIWLTGRFTGNIKLTVTWDESDSVEDVSEYIDATLREIRFGLPRGLRGRYYSFRIDNVDGEPFDLDSMRLTATDKIRAR